MEKVSELLQEAKPLYFQRKRRRTQIKTGLFSLAIVFSVFFSTMGFNAGNFVALNENPGDTSVISEVYDLPVDDYGLLAIY